LARLRDGCGAIAYVELSKDPMQMPLSGPHGDRQLVCKLLIAETTTYSPNNFGLSCAQQFVLDMATHVFAGTGARGLPISTRINALPQAEL